MKKATLPLLTALAVFAAVSALAAPATNGPTIKKCQDATGKWHYGDNAAAACAESKITVINQRGIKKSEIDAPLNADQLKERERREAELAEAKEQAKRDELLLATYSVEADIVYIRDRKIAQLESMIKASTDTLVPLRATLARLEAQGTAEEKANKARSEQTLQAIEQTRAQIGKHEAAIAQRRQEQVAIRAQADKDLERYRQLKSGALREAPAAKR